MIWLLSLLFILSLFTFLGTCWLKGGFHNHRVILTIYLVNIVVIMITFRNRGVEAVGLDGQLIFKMGVWLLSAVIVLVNVRRIISGWNFITIGFGIYVAVMVVSVSYSPNLFYSFSAVFVFGMLFFYTKLVFSIFSTNDLTLYVFKTLLVFCFISFFLYIFSPSMVTQGYWGELGEISGARYKGLSSNGNEMGQVAAILLILSAYLRNAIGLNQKYFYIALLLGGGSLIASWSRMSIVGGGFAVLYLLYSNRPVIAYWLLSVICTLCMSFFVFFDVISQFLPAISRSGAVEELFTFTGRTFIWEAVWKLIQESPYFGYSYASSKTLIPLHFEMPWGWTTVNSHSFVLQMLLSTGFLGSFPLVSVLLFQLLRVFTLKDIFASSLFLFVVITGLLESGAYGPIPNFMTMIWMYSLFLYKDS